MTIDSYLASTIFRTGLDEQSPLKPIRFSLAITVAYILMVSAYIWLSGEVALSVSDSPETLATIERVKGRGYVLVTAIALFLCLHFTLTVIKKQHNTILAQHKSIIASERLVMAGIFSSSVCHDINNIMSVITGNTDLLTYSKNLTD